MTEHEMRSRLMGLTALASEYCMTVENATETERNEFIALMLRLLPKLYLEFNDIRPDAGKGPAAEDEDAEFAEDLDNDFDEFAPVRLEDTGYGESAYYSDYVDEDYYENVRRHIENLLGPDDTYLETFEEDMKYSDTPIAASISESLADIFQPLYNFISIVKDSEGDELEGAYRQCYEAFCEYWSQTLCNVLRALNHLYFSNSTFAGER